MIIRSWLFITFIVFYFGNCFGIDAQNTAPEAATAIKQQPTIPAMPVQKAAPSAQRSPLRKSRLPKLPGIKPQPAAVAAPVTETKPLSSPAEKKKQEEAKKQLDTFFKDLEGQIKKLEAEAKKQGTDKKEVVQKSDNKETTPVVAPQIDEKDVKPATTAEAKNS